jgi:hypothetical protein
MPKFLKKSLSPADELKNSSKIMLSCPHCKELASRAKTLAEVPGHRDSLTSFFERKGLMSEEGRKPGETTGSKLACPANKSK